MYQQPPQTQFLTISYRNGVYQGHFNSDAQSRSGFGLIYITDNPMVMASNWNQDRANQQTFVFYNHSHYTYGYWADSIPHGFNAVRMDKIVIMGFYQMGVIKGRLLVVYEHYNLAIVLQKGQGENQFVEITKGDIFSDQDFNIFIKECKWPQFQQSWKTLIKFMASNIIKQQGEESSQRPKLRLVNKQYYRFGFNQGIAVVFDDQYRIISIGLHKKATLKSLGVRFPKENFVEEGNFNTQSQIFAFNYGHRPENKIGKVYSNYLLKCTQFVNKYLNNPARLFINYLQQLIKSNLFRKLLAGQITTRKLENSYGTPPQTNRFSTIQRQPIKADRNQQAKDLKKQELQKIKQQKQRLQIYRKQLYDTINKKSRTSQQVQQSLQEAQKRKLRQQIQNKIKVNPIIHKPPVQLVTKNSQKKLNTSQSRSRRRSPIFADNQSRSPSPSPSSVSPFRQRIKSKISYQNKQNKQGTKRYLYAPIQQQLYPRHTTINIKKYNSPHQQLQFSPSRAFQNNQQVLPVSVKRQKYVQNREKEFQKQKQLQKQLQRQKVIDKQRQRVQQQIQKQKQRQRQLQEERQRIKKQAQQKYRQKEKLPVNKSRQQKQKTKKLSTGSISFRNHQQKESDRDFSNTNVPSIIISHPHKSKSPVQKKIIAFEPKPVSPQNQKYQKQINKKNNVYLKENFVDQAAAGYQLKRQIKGNTYLQKYNKTKTPQKSKIDSQQKKYNKTIKTFNQNNKIYEKITSPQRLKQKKVVQFQDQVGKKQQKYIESSPIVLKFNETTPNKKKYQYIYE